jgi:hypothetical protein
MCFGQKENRDKNRALKVRTAFGTKSRLQSEAVVIITKNLDSAVFSVTIRPIPLCVSATRCNPKKPSENV